MKVHCNLVADQVGQNKVLFDTNTYKPDKEYVFDIDYTVLKSKVIDFDFDDPIAAKDYEIVLRIEY
jgi:hypothetical protein